MNTYGFIIYIETEDIKDIAEDVERWFDKFNYDENDKRRLPIGKNKKILGLFKDELSKKIKTEFVILRAKTYSFLMDDDSEHKKGKATKRCVIKSKAMFENYTDTLLNDKIILKRQQAFRSDHHNVYNVEINEIALSSNDDKH